MADTTTTTLRESMGLKVTLELPKQQETLLRIKKKKTEKKKQQTSIKTPDYEGHEQYHDTGSDPTTISSRNSSSTDGTAVVSSSDISRLIPHPWNADCLQMDMASSWNDNHAAHNMTSMNNNHTNSSNSSKNQDPQYDPQLIKLARQVLLKQSSSATAAANNPHNSSHACYQTTIRPTPIQMQSWPILNDSCSMNARDNVLTDNANTRNLIAIATTGSGKTLAYALPMVVQAYRCSPKIVTAMMKKKTLMTANGGGALGVSSRVHGVVLVPTRELAIQVSKVLDLTVKLGRGLFQKKQTNSEGFLLSVVAIYGGMEKQTQIETLLTGDKRTRSTNATHNHTTMNATTSTATTTFLIAATPMRLLDLLGISMEDTVQVDSTNNHENHRRENDIMDPNQHTIIRSLFTTTQFLVMDEGDRLATQKDLSQQVGRIVDFLKQTSSCLDHQCLFSATLPQRALQVCHSWISLPRITVQVDAVKVGTKDTCDNEKHANRREENLPNGHSESQSSAASDLSKSSIHQQSLELSTIPSHITQILHVCSNHKKPRKLLHTIQKIKAAEESSKRRQKGLMIIFFGQIKTLQYMEKLLHKENIKCLPLHSQMNQKKREHHLNIFKSGKVPILLATDIAARGIHCNNVEYVINYDFPSTLEQYVHRCGRAGRNNIPIMSTSPEHSSHNKPSSNASVYSFFHRELAPMAKDVLELLRKCNAWIDPNLVALVPTNPDKKDGLTHVSGEPKRKRRKRSTTHEASTWSSNPVVPCKEKEEQEDANHNHGNANDIGMMESEDEQEEFASLGQSRIIFERASHVSLESDSESDHE